MADMVRVDSEGLHAHAALCDTVSAALTAAASPAAAGAAHQATATAVASGNNAVEQAASALSARATSTGFKLRTADGVYRTTDNDSAQSITTTVQV
ncbi:MULTISPECIES: type VII secretion target [Mycobacteriaceae]|uniref:type VII secretion target n=1 Tax=Mycobacteriaceae TaxID=1762 RepID=UPI000928D54F|nr:MULTISPECIES: type VII secretion target [Mycobacteriaceae]MCX8556199.1 type VII secretion target [Mycolicibacterium mucogenicum]SHU95297.1 Protein of uncharacterised function (DUF2580) [Mycobacteroides abscessus subsp. abscessus]SHU98739.1 Protein of uncharacterised function (DUF2580) [Mycobacteroides abscessus subsp. abscessus]SHV60076.1 Protein of uncharacterised function (DUF2580) [Mycobacteroides abscessus subsp. abscessus]SHV82243.1 Protein of uncharacterised function (DUF2580) [Mycoba